MDFSGIILIALVRITIMHLFQKTFCSTKRRKAVVKMIQNTNEKISRKGVVIVLEIQLILSLFLLSINKDFILELHKLVLI